MNQFIAVRAVRARCGRRARPFLGRALREQRKLLAPLASHSEAAQHALVRQLGPMSDQPIPHKSIRSFRPGGYLTPRWNDTPSDGEAQQMCSGVRHQPHPLSPLQTRSILSSEGGLVDPQLPASNELYNAPSKLARFPSPPVRGGWKGWARRWRHSGKLCLVAVQTACDDIAPFRRGFIGAREVCP